MAIRPRLMRDHQFFSSADAFVKPGTYRKFEGEYPPFLREGDSHRRGANTIKMIVATTWQGGQIEQFTPCGETYFVFTFQDDVHDDGILHFNKMVQVATHDSTGNPFRFTMERGIDDHFINAMATGTSLAYLQRAYRIPEKDCGSIRELVNGEFSIDPYPTDET